MKIIPTTDEPTPKNANHSRFLSSRKSHAVSAMSAFEENNSAKASPSEMRRRAPKTQIQVRVTVRPLRNSESQFFLLPRIGDSPSSHPAVARMAMLKAERRKTVSRTGTFFSIIPTRALERNHKKVATMMQKKGEFHSHLKSTKPRQKIIYQIFGDENCVNTDAGKISHALGATVPILE